MQLRLTAILFTLFPLLLPVCTQAQHAAYAKVSAELQELLMRSPDSSFRVQLLLSDRVDPQQLEANYRAQQLSIEERSRRMLQALQEKAASTQSAVLQKLQSVPGVVPGSFASYWITNLIYCDASATAIGRLSEMDEISYIEHDWGMEFPDAVESAPAGLLNESREPGLDVIGAPFMWKKGYIGYGQKVLVVDTGHDTEHPAVAHNFAYNYYPMEQSWANAGQPYYCGSHGTHVGGTIVGLDRLRRDTIGVAFGALWQGSGAQFADCDASSASSEDFTTIFQWAMDPDGNPFTTDDQPDVINNSWSRDLPVAADCGSPITRSIADAVYAAGIAVVFSASNEGPDDSTIGNPPMENWDLVRMFSVGALDGAHPSFNIAGFSSRGPTVCGGEGALLIKPEVSAPGVNVRSCEPDGQYGLKSGTSMSAPHVSGALLLLKEAFPYLSGEELMLALYFSCIDLGPAGEDNTYGRGLISLPAAYQYLLDQGHVPVPPLKSEQDVALLEILAEDRYCENTATVQLLVENNGTDTVQSLHIRYATQHFADTVVWEGLLLPRGRKEIELPAFGGIAGETELTVTLLRANGVADSRELDNQLKTRLNILSDGPLPAGLPTLLPACEGADMIVQSNVDSSTLVSWYNEPEGGQLLGSGPLLSLSGLQSDTTVYMAPRQKAGTAAPFSESDIAGYSNAEAYLTVEAEHDFRLESVMADFQLSGGVLLRQEGPGGDLQLIEVQNPGPQRIELGLDFQAGETYRLYYVAGQPLAYHPLNEETTYSVPNVVRIVADTSDGNNLYPYFYDWEISYDYYCGRTPVQVEVLPGSPAEPLQVSASVASVDLATDNGEVQFSAQTDAELLHYRWDFGDGQISELAAPLHTYADTGTYRVSLLVETVDGCAQAAAYSLQVVDSSPPANTNDLEEAQPLKVFPNPTTGQLFLQFDVAGSERVQLRLLDMLGHTLLLEQRWVAGNTAEPLSLDQLPAGPYILMVEMQGRQLVRRLIKSVP